MKNAFSALCLLLLPILSFAIPSTPTVPLAARQDPSTPNFPSSPPSCVICSGSYSSINNCAAAASVFANLSQVLLNPAKFLTTIECACTDTFQSAFPQCADCFEQTNQTQFLTPMAAQVPSIVSGVRQICALASTILGHPVSVNSEAVGQTPITPTPTASNAARPRASSSGIAEILWTAAAAVGVMAGAGLVLAA
jgi:hypothetical protein